jgi:hypothetical protein
MKKQLLKVLSLAVITLALASCKGKEKDPEPANYFQLDTDAKYVLKEGYSSAELKPTPQEEELPAQEAMYTNVLTLMTEGLVVTADASKGVVLTGKGSGLSFVINTKTSTFDMGTYSFNKQSVSMLGGFWAGYAGVDVSTENSAQGQNYKLTEGKLTVSKSNDVYTIDFEGMVALQGNSTITKSVKGHYVGKIASYVKQ